MSLLPLIHTPYQAGSPAASVLQNIGGAEALHTRLLYGFNRSLQHFPKPHVIDTGSPGSTEFGFSDVWLRITRFLKAIGAAGAPYPASSSSDGAYPLSTLASERFGAHLESICKSAAAAVGHDSSINALEFLKTGSELLHARIEPLDLSLLQSTASANPSPLPHIAAHGSWDSLGQALKAYRKHQQSHPESSTTRHHDEKRHKQQPGFVFKAISAGIRQMWELLTKGLPILN